MSQHTNVHRNLVDVNDSLLIVIDIQDSFLEKYDDAVSQAMVGKVAWLLKFAHALGVPIVAMAEDINNAGSLTQPILDALPDGTLVHNKNVFGLCDNPEILAAAELTGRKTAVLVGLETDVCVAHSALGLLRNGYQVVALKDGMATTQGDEEVGLSRMHSAGVVISSIKSIHYEWLRSVSNTDAVYAAAPQLKQQKPDNLLM